MTAATRRGLLSITSLAFATTLLLLPCTVSAQDGRPYNAAYAGPHLDRVAFPIGGIGAGMICLEGVGCISHVSVRNEMQVFHEPYAYAALCVKGPEGTTAKVLEGPVPTWKTFGSPRTGNGAGDRTYGLPRFDKATFLARFPFATVTLADGEIPLEVEIVGWSPFVPGHTDDSSLPVGALEYRFKNTTGRRIEAVFSFNSKNFMATGRSSGTILPITNGFVLFQGGSQRNPEHEGAFAVFTDDDHTVVDHCWFKGGWWDAVTLAWRNVCSGRPVANPPQKGHCPGASLFVPLEIAPGAERVVRLMLAWYVPQTDLRLGSDDPGRAVGPAFGYGPSRGTAASQQEVTGFLGKGLVNTFDPAGDGQTGTLTSPEFTIDASHLQFLIGGGAHPGTTSLDLLVDGEVVCSATGENLEQLEWRAWDVSRFRGRKARLRIVDQERGAWGHVNVDHIILSKKRFESAADYLRKRAGAKVTVLQDFEGPDFGAWVADGPPAPEEDCEGCTPSRFHRPWYAGHFDSLAEVVAHWRASYDRLRQQSAAFRDAFYDSTLPPEVLEAVAANLTILKSPTVMRQVDGRLWCFEGCSDDRGCCHGSCTHVWNYAQALPHLFPELERSLRRTEFNESQDERGHQTFRSCLPIRPAAHTFHAAADGQLGGIMKVYRDWRISGDGEWLRSLWPQVRQSLDYCIATWDPRGRGVLEEPHHNTYDIEYWGPEGHCSSFYLGALATAIEMGEACGDDVSRYRDLLAKGRNYLENELFDGEYFIQKITTEGLNATFRPLDTSGSGPGYADVITALNTQGPRYQYGTGCLSDGALGFWMARVCGLDQDLVDPAKERSHLEAVHEYNLRRDLSNHANPQRPSFAMGRDGGLLLCTWPKGGKLAIPFVYSDEVWTGIEYQVAAHLMLMGAPAAGLEIVRICRDRHDGRVRNPFDEYECGHWYARALSSYALLQGLTGARYDAVTETLHIDSRVGPDFRSFLSTATGFGTVGLRSGQPFLDVNSGKIDVQRVLVSGKEMRLTASASPQAPAPARAGVGVQPTPAVPVGHWKSVDFVQGVRGFVPGQQVWKGVLSLQRLRVREDGTIDGLSEETCKEGWITHANGRTRARYHLETLGGRIYLFYPWLSGDVTERGRKPSYYVLRKASAEERRAESRPSTARGGRTDSTSDTLNRRRRREPLREVKSYADVRGRDMSLLDLRGRPDLPATLTFDERTTWPALLLMPVPVYPRELMAASMNPGLGIRALHEQGIDGRGINVAIIDQPLRQDHPEYAGKIVAYHDTGCGAESSMHGPAVASLLVGSRCGTAPGARLYYAAAPSWKKDSAYKAKALLWIIEQSRKLPPGQKIRVVSVSAAPSGRGSPFTKNQAQWDEACARAEEAGLIVLDCTNHRGFVGPCYYDTADPEEVAGCTPGFAGRPTTGLRDGLLAPCSRRTAAQEGGEGEWSYIYWGRGGLSWAIPYCAGVLALGWQVCPDHPPAKMRDLLIESAHHRPQGQRVIDPKAFIRLVRSR